MGFVHEDAAGEERPRSLRFGEVADLYDRFRPDYPAELVTDVVALLPGPRVLEVGAGTGKATCLLAGHDLDITCLEPDPAMAAVLRRNTAAFPRITVRPCSFEQWQPDGRLDGIVSAQAWHWADPATKWQRAADSLHTGGVLGLFWNHEAPEQDAVFHAIVDSYAGHGVPSDERPVGRPDESDGSWVAKELAEFPQLRPRPWRYYAWQQRYTGEEFASFLDTTSHHRLLADTTRTGLHADIVRAIDGHGGEFVLRRVTQLLLIDRV